MDGSDFTRVEAVVLHIGLTLVTYWAFRQVLPMLLCCELFNLRILELANLFYILEV